MRSKVSPVFILLVLALAAGGLVQAFPGGEKNGLFHSLGDPYPRIVHQVFYHVEEKYVVPERASPRKLVEGAPRALETRKADAYGYAILFCALNRAAGVPARPVAGYLLERGGGTARDYWAEFYVESVGWVPVDPYLGEGRLRVWLPPDAKPQTYYFGNLGQRRSTDLRYGSAGRASKAWAR